MAPYLGQKAGPDSRELVRSLVEARLSILTDDAYMFGTIGDKPSKPSSVGTHITSRISNFVNSDAAKGAIHSAASKAFTSVQHHHKAIIASALIYSVQHAAHIDVAPGDVEEHLHHQIEHLGTNLKISKDMAHGVLTHAVGKLKELRGIKEAIEKDDELDAAITRLHKILKKIEPHYREPAKDQPQDQIKKVPPVKQGKVNEGELDRRKAQADLAAEKGLKVGDKVSHPFQGKRISGKVGHRTNFVKVSGPPELVVKFANLEFPISKDTHKEV